ncbi:MAG: hypothetical protein R2828_32795 [Saprospiraceae bacterium]
MGNKISISFAGNVLLLLLGLLFIFHLLVLFRVIPYDIVWAGKINSRKELIRMESISLLVSVVAAIIVSLKMGYLNFLQYPTIINIGIWILFVFFNLNTIGNLTAKSPIEKYGFSFLTFRAGFLS